MIEGPINGALFQLDVETQLAPTLAEGDIVIPDILGSHKGAAAREALAPGVGRLASLTPPPDLPRHR